MSFVTSLLKFGFTYSRTIQDTSFVTSQSSQIETLTLSRKGPDAVGSLSAGRLKQPFALQIVNFSTKHILQIITFVVQMAVSRPAERLPTASGPFLDLKKLTRISIQATKIQIFDLNWRLFPYWLMLSLIHIWRCRRYAVCRSRWSPYH